MADKVLDALQVAEMSVLVLVLAAEDEWHGDACDVTEEMMHESAELLRTIQKLKADRARQ